MGEPAPKLSPTPKEQGPEQRKTQTDEAAVTRSFEVVQGGPSEEDVQTRKAEDAQAIDSLMSNITLDDLNEKYQTLMNQRAELTKQLINAEGDNRQQLEQQRADLDVQLAQVNDQRSSMAKLEANRKRMAKVDPTLPPDTEGMYATQEKQATSPLESNEEYQALMAERRQAVAQRDALGDRPGFFQRAARREYDAAKAAADAKVSEVEGKISRLTASIREQERSEGRAA